MSEGTDLSTPEPVRRSSNPRNRLESEAWPVLDVAVVEQLRAAGTTRRVEVGDVLFDVGQDSYALAYVERGAVSIVDRANDHVVARIDAGNFLGEIGMLMGQRTFFAGVVSVAGQIIEVQAEALRELVATVPEVGDAVVGAFAARRRLLMEWGEGGLVIVGDENDTGARRLLEFVSRNQVPHRWLDRSDTRSVAALAETCDLPTAGTAVVTGRSAVLAAPSTRELARAVGLDLAADTQQVFDLLVVGAGPAGLAASVYAASEGLSVVVVEDTAIGGQAGTSSRIENYLGFPKGVSGTELAYRGQIQAVKFGARIVAPRRATRLTPRDDIFEVELDDDTILTTKTLILANGVQYRRLPLDRLAELEGRGVYYAATELEARFCRNTEVVIVGGGNSAGQAAMFLSRYATCTHIVVRGEGLAATMSQYLASRIESDRRIKLWTHTEVVRLDGGDSLEEVTLRNHHSGDQASIESKALFVMIGAAPNTDWLDEQIGLDSHGFVLTGRDAGPGLDSYATTLPGVYAVGDLRSGSVKRVASAVGEGSVVISSVHKYLESLDAKGRRP
ncbi:MAG: FAD-dependent oxidoreductase [Acidobacteriota bacterium]